MSNLVFPTLPGIEFPVQRAPLWKTSIKEAMNGREYRLAFFSNPRYQYRVSFEALRNTALLQEIQQLIGLFNAVYGSWDTFLWADDTDYAVTAQPFGVGDGVTKSFQLVRTFGNFVEPVYDLQNTPSIYINAVLKANGVDYTLNSLLNGGGLVTFTTAPAAGTTLSWTGSYYWRCRFLKDSMDFEEFLNDLWQAKQVEFITVRP
jgi:uncharacterized protein (TIGR02217 family)